METKNLDILGQACPACLLVALREINENRDKLKTGDIEIVIRTDHRDATRTIPDSARAMGYAVDIKRIDTYYEITIGKRK
ncbi:hypothetical protein JZK55_19980 [Dissulfurispira thermophila]|uniref:UPF0033 domain-containing protein n=2 Tax=root TaxID=1 RepID=A0A7G1H580_9BACT|nr:sulfurtransferase TusA family protein [Dissulfurispira thermophila]BCB97076.1 hypothetical protein JZK55_19980 [Dissulfurispira thermophila]